MIDDVDSHRGWIINRGPCTVNVRIVDAPTCFQSVGYSAILSRLSLSDIAVTNDGYFVAGDKFGCNY